MRSVMSKVVGADPGAGNDGPNAGQATGITGVGGTGAGGGQGLCAGLQATPTMGSEWTKERMLAGCEEWLAGQSEAVTRSLSPFEVCTRMGACGTAEQRAVTRQAASMDRTAVLTRRAAQQERKFIDPTVTKKEWLPKLESVTPDCLPATQNPAAKLTVTLRGKGFVKGDNLASKCLFNRIASPSSVVKSDTEMECEVPFLFIASPADLQVYGPSPPTMEMHLSSALPFNACKKK
jgi:hypothetical protein